MSPVECVVFLVAVMASSSAAVLIPPLCSEKIIEKLTASCSELPCQIPPPGVYLTRLQTPNYVSLEYCITSYVDDCKNVDIFFRPNPECPELRPYNMEFTHVSDEQSYARLKDQSGNWFQIHSIWIADNVWAGHTCTESYVEGAELAEYPLAYVKTLRQYEEDCEDYEKVECAVAAAKCMLEEAGFSLEERSICPLMEGGYM